MPGDRIEINGCKFDVSPLQPFGERWQPTEGGIFVDTWINRDVGAIIEEVEKRSMIVIGDTKLSPENTFTNVPPLEGTLKPHIDGSNKRVHILHSDGNRAKTSYAKNEDMSAIIKTNLDYLKDAIEQTPEDIRKDFCLDLLLAQFSAPEKHLYHIYFELDDLNMMRIKLMEYRSLASGLSWSAYTSEDQARKNYHALFSIYEKLLKFYIKIGLDTKKYTQDWQKDPNSTVLSNHNTQGNIDNLIYHFREAFDDFSGKESPLKRAYIAKTGQAFQLVYSDFF